MLFLVYEGLSHWGVFDYTQDKIERAMAVYTDIKEKLVESSEFVSEVASTLEGFHSAVGSTIEPWRAFAYLVSAAFCYWFMSDMKEMRTPGSSPGASPGSSPGSNPPITPRIDEVSKAMQTMANAFEKQAAMPGMIVGNQENMKERMTQSAEARRTAELLREVEGGRASGPDMLKDMMQRIDGFEAVLKSDRVGLDGAAGGETEAPRVGGDPPSRATQAGAEKEKHSDVQAVIEKLKRTAERPHETYMQHLTEYGEVNAEE